jgi:MerR family transcriptional regulator, light-induced transcriptional regulator
LAELYSSFDPAPRGDAVSDSSFKGLLRVGGKSALDRVPASQPLLKDTRFASLGEIVEGEIIPRLMLAHRPQAAEVAATSAVNLDITDDVIEAFAQLAIGGDIECLLDVADALMSRGVSIESLHWDLIDLASKRLDALWQDDQCAFVDVTMGTTLLQQIVHELSFRAPTVGQADGPSIFFAAMPRQRTHLCLAMAEETFRRSGWQTWAEMDLSGPAIAEIAGAHAFDMICLSVDQDYDLDQVSEITTSVRRTSRNRAIRVMLLGRVPPDVVDLHALADVAVCEGREILMQAERAMGRAVSRR